MVCDYMQEGSGPDHNQIKKKIEDTKVMIRSRNSKGDRKCNSQNKRDKKTSNDLQNST